MYSHVLKEVDKKRKPIADSDLTEMQELNSHGPLEVGIGDTWWEVEGTDRELQFIRPTIICYLEENPNIEKLQHTKRHMNEHNGKRKL